MESRILSYRLVRADPDYLVPLTGTSLRDVSASGVRIRTTTRGITENMDVLVCFTLAGHAYRLAGRVVWTRALPNDAFECGLEFTGVSDADRERLARSILRLLPPTQTPRTTVMPRPGATPTAHRAAVDATKR